MSGPSRKGRLPAAAKDAALALARKGLTRAPPARAATIGLVDRERNEARGLAMYQSLNPILSSLAQLESEIHFFDESAGPIKTTLLVLNFSGAPADSCVCTLTTRNPRVARN